MRSWRAGVTERAPGSSVMYSSMRLASAGDDADAARALRQPLHELLAFAEVRVDDDLLLARERFADGLGVHVGIAVHVAADPGAEVQERGSSSDSAGTP